ASVSISSNGAPPYQYSLDGSTWQASSQFAGLAAGNYTVYFRDQNQCAGSQTFTVNQPSALTFTPSEQAALCNGASNGLVMIAASGGVAPYQYSIDGLNYQAVNSFNVPAGNYTIYVKDQNNCVQSQQVSVGEPALLSASSTTSNASCAGGADGVITITSSGGTSPYQYSIDGIYYQASNVFNVIAGNYTVLIKDANGCTTSNNVAVGLTNNLYVSPAADQTVCEGIGVELEPVTNATEFIWTPAQGLNASNIKKPVATPSVTTDYYVQTILGVCSAYDTIRVNVLPAPVANAGTDAAICFGQSVQLTGSGGTQYIWSPDNYMNTSLAADPIVTPAQTIQYLLHVVDANGCRSLQPDIVTVNVTPPIVVRISKDTVVANGDVFQLFANSVATDYAWIPAFGLDDASKATPVVTVTGDITYTVTATTSAGCKGEASVILKVFNGPEIYVPTAFTPNGDGKNDLFKPFPVGIKNYTYFRIYNRWGQEIYSTADFNRGWDGTISGKQQPTGTYVWIVEGITKENKKIVKRGTIILVR
ncbi:MAG: T9SS type B sorting domain-containing protein, partial [Flavisolibacter sp.]